MKIKKNISEISFNKSKSKPVNKFFGNALLFNLDYKDKIKSEWMKNNTKYIIDNKERFNFEIIDIFEYITSNEDLVNKIKEIE